ncbi:TonB-dependent receptor [Sphingobacterium lactis]|uniref:Outer membrane receptor proteins, mostly Fe transport n=1 Tax=Sphingobacterium lactis TaxID=797291 RepID=A0A1H5WNF8_9SPHI|nr:TonB-dependent receptor [Sphingobacterium lactis]SEG00888.1 hypothetical protein SAMN05421877_104110 [Sphingobacterium lactis]
MRIFLGFLILFFLSLPTFAQVQVSGRILDLDQKPISNVSISYKKIGQSAILGYSRSGADGSFSLTLAASGVDSVILDLNHLSYKRRTLTIPNRSATYAYMLEPGDERLKEIVVTNRPISQRKDTLIYQVGAFTNRQDRVIADIIRKLPGIEMNGNQILYQGKPIQKFKVNNLDLMEGRYNMITNNLPADAVKNVEVIENDQPIRILDSIEFSDRATINLELKEFTTTGTGKVGLGASHFLWNLNLTPMTFGKKMQMLNSIQTNNIGHNVASDLQPFYSGSGMVSRNPEFGDGPEFIHVQEVSTPGFDEKKWLNNKIFLASSNILRKFTNEVELKANLSYYDDSQRQQGYTSTYLYTADETLHLTEDVDNRFRINAFDGGLLVEKNAKQIFLRNSLRYRKHWNSDRGNLIFNADQTIQQQKAHTDEALQNDLNIARLFGKQMVNFNSSIRYQRTPQRLTVTPGQFEDLINNGNPYAGLTQRVDYTGFRWNNGIQLSRAVGSWRFTPGVEVNYEKSSLNTDITTATSTGNQALEKPYINDMDNNRLHAVANLGIQRNSDRWKFSMALPYNFYAFDLQQQGMNVLEKETQHTFNPSVNLNFLLNSNHDFAATASRKTNFAGFDNLYSGYLLTQYRNLQRYDARILRTINNAFNLQYNVKNPLKARFASLGYAFTLAERDHTFAAQLDALGRSTTTILNQDGQNLRHQFQIYGSTFIRPLKTILKLYGNLGWGVADYYINGEYAKFRDQSQAGTFELVSTFSSAVNTSYKATVGNIRNSMAGGMTNHIFYHNHFLHLAFAPGETHIFSISPSLYDNNTESQRNQFFLDANYRYRIKKWKTDIDVSFQNILNNNSYLRQFNSTYELIQSSFTLRPRQILISTSFKF